MRLFDRLLRNANPFSPEGGKGFLCLPGTGSALVGLVLEAWACDSVVEGSPLRLLLLVPALMGYKHSCLLAFWSRDVGFFLRELRATSGCS